jgi:hypothetical protein
MPRPVLRAGWGPCVSHGRSFSSVPGAAPAGDAGGCLSRVRLAVGRTDIRRLVRLPSGAGVRTTSRLATGHLQQFRMRGTRRVAPRGTGVRRGDLSGVPRRQPHSSLVGLRRIASRSDLAATIRFRRCDHRSRSRKLRFSPLRPEVLRLRLPLVFRKVTIKAAKGCQRAVCNGTIPPPDYR